MASQGQDVYRMQAQPQQQRAGPAVYGAESSLKLRPTHHTRKFNLLSVVPNLLAPFLYFVVALSLMTFSLRYTSSGMCWIFMFVLLFLVLAGAWHVRKSAMRTPVDDREPSWSYFVLGMCLLSWIAALILGSVNYYGFTLPFYTYGDMALYPFVDPSEMAGSQYLDAGRIIFTGNSFLDMNKAGAFKDGDLYCVVPISSNDTQKSYDYWAVGVNCCANQGGDFRCGEYWNPNAVSGLRELDTNHGLYFKLAVEQTMALYDIRAMEYPIFLSWMQDPVAEVDGWMAAAKATYQLEIFAGFLVMLFVVAAAATYFARRMQRR